MPKTRTRSSTGSAAPTSRSKRPSLPPLGLEVAVVVLSAAGAPTAAASWEEAKGRGRPRRAPSRDATAAPPAGSPHCRNAARAARKAGADRAAGSTPSLRCREPPPSAAWERGPSQRLHGEGRGAQGSLSPGAEGGEAARRHGDGLVVALPVAHEVHAHHRPPRPAPSAPPAPPSAAKPPPPPP